MKKLFCTLGILATSCVAFTLTACGGGGTSEGGSEMTVSQFASGAKEFQTLAPNAYWALIYADPSTGTTTQTADSVTVHGWVEVPNSPNQRYRMLYTYKQTGDAEYSMTFSITEGDYLREGVRALANALGVGRDGGGEGEEGGGGVNMAADPLSLVFNMESKTVHVTRGEGEDQATTDIPFRILPKGQF